MNAAYGYTRPFTAAEDLTADITSLRDAGVHSPSVESSPTSGKVLAVLISNARPGDTLLSPGSDITFQA